MSAASDPTGTANFREKQNDFWYINSKWLAFMEDVMTQPFPIRFFLTALLMATGGVIPLATEAQEQPLPNSHIPLCMEDCVHDCMGHDNPTDRGNCLDREKCYQQPACPTKGGGASFSIDRGPTKGEIHIKCAVRDSTKQCVDAVSPIISAGEGSTTVVYATSSIKCGSTIYEVTNGIDGGTCQTAGGGGGKPNDIVKCSDREGNTVASADCSSGCGSTSESGKCTIK